MENKTITITEEQFAVAIAEAIVRFEAGMDSVGDMPSISKTAMTMQNMMFGVEIKRVLFDKTQCENKGEE